LIYARYRKLNPAAILTLKARHVITSGPFGAPLPKNAFEHLEIPLRRVQGVETPAWPDMDQLAIPG
jgi:hypothetical protein